MKKKQLKNRLAAARELISQTEFFKVDRTPTLVWYIETYGPGRGEKIFEADLDAYEKARKKAQKLQAGAW